MANLTLGNLVRDRRLAKDLTREQLASKAGTSTSTVTRLEREDHVPLASTLVEIAKVLDVSVDDLMAAAK